MTLSLTTSLQNIQIAQAVEDFSLLSAITGDEKNASSGLLIADEEPDDFNVLLQSPASSDEVFCVVAPLQPVDTLSFAKDDASSLFLRAVPRGIEKDTHRIPPREAGEGDNLFSIIVDVSMPGLFVAPTLLTEPLSFVEPSTAVFVSDTHLSEVVSPPMTLPNFSVASEPSEARDASLITMVSEILRRDKSQKNPADLEIERSISALVLETEESKESVGQNLVVGSQEVAQREAEPFLLHREPIFSKGSLLTQEASTTTSLSPVAVFSALLDDEPPKQSFPVLTNTEITSVLKQVSERFSLIKNLDENGTPFLRLQLYPEHLGTLEVKVIFREGELFLHFTGETLTMDLLQRHAQQLTQALGEQGFQLTSDQMAFGFSSSREHPQNFFDEEFLYAADFWGDAQENRTQDDTSLKISAGGVNILVATHFTKPTTQGDLALC